MKRFLTMSSFSRVSLPTPMVSKKLPWTWFRLQRVTLGKKTSSSGAVVDSMVVTVPDDHDHEHDE